MPCGALPVPGGRLTSAFGQRGPRFHEGVDIKAPEGTPVRTVLPGVVMFVSPSGRWERYGNTVVVDHGKVLGLGGSLISLYAHLRSVSVSVGESVAMGAELGQLGRTAGLRADPSHQFDVSAAHLHLEFFEAGRAWSLNSPRVDAGKVLGALGLVAPAGGAMFPACGGGKVAELEPRAAPARAAAGGALALALLAFLAWKYV